MVSIGTILSALTLSCSLPCQYDHTIHGHGGAKVHHEHRLVHIVVIHDGTVWQVGVFLAIHSKGAMAVLPLFPGVALIIHPGVAQVGFVRDWGGEDYISFIQLISHLPTEQIDSQKGTSIALWHPHFALLPFSPKDQGAKDQRRLPLH